MELSNQVEPVPNAIFIGAEPTVDIRKVSNHSSSSSYSDYSKSQTKYIIGPPSTSSRKSRRQASPKIQRSQKPPRSPKSPRRKLRTKSLSKKFRRSIGQELERFLERESASDDLQVVISQMVQDMNEKDKTIRLLQDVLAKTNLAVIRLQENMKEVQAQLKGDRMESEEVPAMIPPSVENSPVASDQKESIDAERITELSAQLKHLEFNNKSDRKKRRKRSSREKTGKASKRSKRKARQNAKAEQNLDPAVLKTVFQKRVKKLIAAHNFFTATALKIYEARRDVDKKSFAESTYKLDDAISKHQIVENLEDIMSRRHQQQSSPRRSSFMSTGSEEDVPHTIQLRWKDDENLHEVHLVEPMCDKYTRDEFFYTADEIKLFRFDKFMEDNAQEFDFEIIDSDEESWDEEIIEEEDEELDEDASLLSHASQVTL